MHQILEASTPFKNFDEEVKLEWLLITLTSEAGSVNILCLETTATCNKLTHCHCFTLSPWGSM